MLVRGLGGTVVECAFVVDLPDLGGRAKLEKMGLTVFTLCEFEGD
jgi:adenine phosphoribosyltransferase